MKKLLSLAILLVTGVTFGQNISQIDQNGYVNLALVDQIGADNLSHVAQDGLIFGVGAGGDLHTAIVLQVGVENYSDVHQLGFGNFGVVEQIGAFNEAIQYAGDVGGVSIFNEAYVLQVGAENLSEQAQEGNFNLADVIQIGAFNDALQIQEGNDNIAIIEQTGSFNHAEQIQVGDLNWALSSQTGSYNWAYHMQNSTGGGENISEIYQDSAVDGHMAMVTQTSSAGTFNYSGILQEDLFGFGGNYAEVTQDAIGSSNASLIFQFGTNTAIVNQTGL